MADQHTETPSVTGWMACERPVIADLGHDLPRTEKSVRGNYSTKKPTTTMGNYIGYINKNGESQSFRTGGNGSGHALLKLFAVAYATSGLPDQKRARDSVKPMRHESIQAQYYNISRKEQVMELIGLSMDDCFWVDFDLQRSCGGYFLKPPQCPVYRAIMAPLIIMEVADGSLLLPAERVEETAKAWRQMLPILAGSPAYGKLSEIVQIAEGAAANHAILSIS